MREHSRTPLSRFKAFAFAMLFGGGMHILASCDQNEDAVGSVNSATDDKQTSCEVGEPSHGKLYVKSNDVNFRTGPGTNYDRVINERATSVLGRTIYRTLWTTAVLEARCETADWIKGDIVEADGKPVFWESGWVLKKFIAREMSDDQAAGLLWDIDAEPELTVADKKILLQGARKVLKDEPNCASIYTGYYSEKKRGSYYVTCNAKNGKEPFNVWFSSDEIASNSKLGIPVAYPEQPSRVACEQEILGQATYPSTVSFHRILGYATTVHNNGNRTIIQEFSAKNGFGLDLEYHARCLVLPSGKIELSMTEVGR
ncbi:MAG: hypothetical protein H5U13_00990 [Parvibaculum sp.]|nr:hypothetical protein [Parvibaculum sp.]